MAYVSIRFDLRVPPFARVTHDGQYRACLDQCEWADRNGLHSVLLAEHHGVEDGFMPSPLTLAAAIAGRTRDIRITIAAALVPLHDPVRFAEQAATVALVSGGRLSIVAGMGYRHEEFEMAGVERSQRGRLLEEYVEVMRKAWTGEPFEWRGRTIRVTPKPASPPRLMLGGSTEKAARRAAQLHALFFPSIADPHLVAIYEAECARVGYRRGQVALPGGPTFVHVSEDPERDWEKIAPHALYDAATYASWQTPGQRSQSHTKAQTLDELKRGGIYAVVTPDECVAIGERERSLNLHPLMGGLAPELGRQSLQLVEKKVLPRLRASGALREAGRRARPA